MPQSAPLTGLVDHILSVEDMPDRLIDYQQHLIAAAGWTIATMHSR